MIDESPVGIAGSTPPAEGPPDIDLRAVDGRLPGRRGLATRKRLLAATASLLETTGYRDLKVVEVAREAGTLTEEQSAFVRIATNLVKMRSCQHSHRVVLTGIETLGGNGAIETFSVMPRLLRDNIVYENWEGTHNTLLAQTHRDFARYGLHKAFLARLRAKQLKL